MLEKANAMLEANVVLYKANANFGPNQLFEANVMFKANAMFLTLKPMLCMKPMQCPKPKQCLKLDYLRLKALQSLLSIFIDDHIILTGIDHRSAPPLRSVKNTPP